MRFDGDGVRIVSDGARSEERGGRGGGKVDRVLVLHSAGVVRGGGGDVVETVMAVIV